MLFQIPGLTAADRAVLDLIVGQRERLRAFTDTNPTRWLGSLRRSTFARAIQGSNSIEGYHATIDDAIAVVENEPATDADQETFLAIKGYRDALTYVMQAIRDPHFALSTQLLKSLHFMMLGHDLTRSPGHWRPGTVFVVDDATRKTVYTAPDADLVNGLMEALVAAVADADRTHAIVRAAMAHLNLTMIHPFRDGNGRMARALQTLVLARDGILHPVFSSIEEWLGRNTAAYYAVLAEVGQGRWNPQRDAGPWIRFCLTAHHQQAATLIRRNEEYGRLFDEIEALLRRDRLPERAAVPLFDAALGWRLTNARYRADAEVAENSASRDLKRLAAAGWLAPHGERRGRTYRATPALAELRARTRLPRPLEDPYAIVEARRQPRLDLPDR